MVRDQHFTPPKAAKKALEAYQAQLKSLEEENNARLRKFREDQDETLMTIGRRRKSGKLE